MTNVLKKAFTWSVVAVTLLWSVGFAAFAPMIAQAAECPELEAGDLWKTASKTAVYMQNEDGEALAFPNEKTFLSWGLDFGDVVTLSNSCAEDLELAGFVPYAPGTLVYRDGFGTVYVVGINGAVTPFADYAALDAVFGANAVAKSRMVSDSHWLAAYDNTGDELDGTMLPDGLFVKTSASSDVYFVLDGMLYDVEGTVPAPWMVVTVSADLLDSVEMADESMTASEIAAMAVDEVLMGSGSTDDGEDDTTPAGGDLEVSVAGSTPDSATVPAGALAVPYLTFVVEAGSADVAIEQVTVRRGGIGDDDGFEKVYIYNNGVRVDNGRSLNNDGEATFNVNMEIGKGDSETFEVRADLATSTSFSGDENYFEIIEVNTDGGDVEGLPVRGNKMVHGSRSIGSVTVDGTGSDSTVEIGQDDVLVAQFSIEADGDDMNVASVRLQNGGSAETDVLSNIVMKVGGTTLATGSIDDEYVQFNFEDMYSIEDGESKTFKVYADISITDSGDDFVFFVDEESDVVAYSEDYEDYQALVTITDYSAEADSFSVTVEGGDVNVDFDGEDMDVRVDQNDAVFGVFTITPMSEDLDIDEMRFTLVKNASGSECLDDIRIRDKNGRGTYSLDAVAAECSTSNNNIVYAAEDLTLTQGVTYEFEVVADVSSETTAEGDTYTFSWSASGVTGEGVESDNAITSDDFSSGALTGPTVTVEGSSLVVRSLALSDDTVVNGTDNVLLFRGTMQAGDVSDVVITSMTVGSSTTNSAEWDEIFDSLKLFIKKGGSINPTTDVAVDVDNSPDADGAMFEGFNVTVKAGSAEKVTFEIYGDVTDGNETGDVDVQIEEIEGTDADDEDVDAENSSGTAISSSPVVGSRTLTVSGTGTLTAVVDTDYTGIKNDKYVLAGTDSVLVGRVKLQADNEDVMLEDLVLVSTSSASTQVVEETFSTVGLYSSPDLSAGSLLVEEDMTEGDITFTGVDYTVKNGATQYIYIGVKVNSIGTSDDGTATASTTVEFRAKDAGTTAQGVSSNDDINPTVSEGTWTNEVTVVGTKVEVSSTFADGNLSGGTQNIFSFKVKAMAGGNTDTDGEVLTSVLSQVKLQLSTDVGTASSSNVTGLKLCRVGSSESCLDLETADTLSDSTTTVALQTSGDSSVVNMTDLSGDDEYVDDGETVEYVVKATVSNVTDRYLQVTIVDLDDAGLVWGYDVDNGGVDFTHSDLRADSRTSDYPDLVAGTLD